MKLALELARSPAPPFAQPAKSRVANVPVAKSRVLAAPVLRILSRKGFTGVVGFENFLIIFSTSFLRALSVVRVTPAIGRQSKLSQPERAINSSCGRIEDLPGSKIAARRKAHTTQVQGER